MRAPYLFILVCLALFAHPVRAQEEESQVTSEEELQITAKDSIVISSWMVGLGVNAVDDSGNMFDGLFRPSDEWNMLPYPSRISIGRYFKNGLGIEAIGTLNKYKEGKIIDNVVNMTETEYYGIDGRITYDLNKIVGETGWFDPYVGIGAGYTEANNIGRGTYNAIVGFRTWFTDRWGLDFNSTGKWAMSKEDASNHLQHAAGVVYRFGIEKGLSKRGEEKKELIEAIAKEKQRQQDSIAEANRLLEEALLAERLEKEREAAALAAAEKAEQAEQERQAALRNTLKDKVENLGNVLFKFNSSYLTSNDKAVLDALIKIMEDNPTLVVEVTSHADARGPDPYNQWLSERRLERTLAYLYEKGLAEKRIVGEAKGERELKNECGNGVRCPEDKHQENRRSDFRVLEF